LFAKGLRQINIVKNLIAVGKIALIPVRKLRLGKIYKIALNKDFLFYSL